MQQTHITVIGGGVAGCEAAYQASIRGHSVHLYEMRPETSTGMHRSGTLAELIGSNSFGPERLDKSSGLLIEELRRLGSLTAAAADAARIDNAFDMQVDARQFSRLVQRTLQEHPGVTIISEEATLQDVQGPVVIATGPRTTSPLARELYRITGQKYQFFYGATEPLLEAASIDMQKAWRESRFDGDTPEYLNCALDESGFEQFVRIMHEATGRYDDLQHVDFFTPLLPLELYADEDPKRLLSGALNAAGLTNPATGHEPYAACQLAPVDDAESVWRIVNARTGAPAPLQEKMWRTFPALAEAQFVNHGGLYQAVYINAPEILHESLQLRGREKLLVAGGLVGVCSYSAAAALGWMAGVNAARIQESQPPLTAPVETLTGAILQHVAHGSGGGNYGVMFPNFGLLPPFKQSDGDTRDRKIARSEHALEGMEKWAKRLGITAPELSSAPEQ